MTFVYRPPSFSGNNLDLGDRVVKLVFSMRRPQVALIGAFLDDDECAALIECGADRLEPATVFELSDGSKTISSFRTSWHAKLERAKDTVVSRIEARTSRLAGLPDSHGELIEVIRYQEGQTYRPHWDWFDPETDGGSRRIAAFGQRVATVILYLNDGFEGGSTVLSRIGLDVRPQKGSALFFCNVDEMGQGNRRTLHAGAPVLSGEKWIATRWFASRPQATNVLAGF
jgi:prolyl 4-hydroxylase